MDGLGGRDVDIVAVECELLTEKCTELNEGVFGQKLDIFRVHFGRFLKFEVKFFIFLIFL